jgi:hypothetical protein
LSASWFLGIGNTMHVFRASGDAAQVPVLLKTRDYQGVGGGAGDLARQLFSVFTYDQLEPGE